MQYVLISPATLCTFALGLALTWTAQSAERPAGPCEQIIAACTNAGFVKGDAREGYGLWRDCVDPLPAVSPELVAACRQIHPNFGEGKKAGQAK
jgi:hypothetical protein